VAHKIKDCQEVGFISTLIRLEEEVSEERLLAEVEKLNRDPGVDGFIVQLPLPAHISEQKVIEAIDPSKDVDGFHPDNLENLLKKSGELLNNQNSVSAINRQSPRGETLPQQDKIIMPSAKSCSSTGVNGVVLSLTNSPFSWEMS
jgi:hypothetical protein